MVSESKEYKDDEVGSTVATVEIESSLFESEVDEAVWENILWFLRLCTEGEKLGSTWVHNLRNRKAQFFIISSIVGIRLN